MIEGYVNALRVEQHIARRFDIMERVACPVNMDRMREVYEQAVENLTAIEEHVVPNIPMTPTSGGWAVVEKPFTAKGEPSANVKKHMEEFTDQVAAPFCKVKWNVINIGSDKQVKKYLLSIGWKPTEWNIDKKKGKVNSPKLTEDSFDSIDGDVGQQIALYLKLKHRRSMIEGFMENVVKHPDGTTRLAQVISGMTPTFRCTHKKVVNVPNGDSVFGLAIRSIFAAPKGYKFVGVDAKSCQLRMLCHYMKDPIYTEAVMHGSSDDGTDIHSVNMRMTGGLLTKRSQAKRFIYGLLFGGGDAKLGAILGGDKHDGKRLRKTFMDQLPTLAELLKGLKGSWEARGYLLGLDGRRVYVRSTHMLLVYLVQSAEAILMRYALWLLEEWGFYDKFDVDLILFNHDEFQFMVKDTEGQPEKVAEWVCAAISSASEMLGLRVPAEGDVKIGKDWAETH